jgi:ubiquinone/menaquinone biosynthesis C-methylase UbiE
MTTIAQLKSSNPVRASGPGLRGAASSKPEKPSANTRIRNQQSTAHSITATMRGVKSIIRAVRDIWGLLALIALIVGGLIYTVAKVNRGDPTTIVLASLIFFSLIIGAVTYVTVRGHRPMEDHVDEPEDKAEADQKEALLAENRDQVLAANAPPTSLDKLTLELGQLKDVIHQSGRYSTPTYYLNAKLQVIDWNIAFELLFKPILHKIRRRHVNHLIAELSNRDAVFNHARDFTKAVKAGLLPLVDMEPLEYNSQDYGPVLFQKIACQLTDTDGNLRAWSVALLIQEIDWDRFNADLLPRLRDHKSWSVYAVSYDAILLSFPPYLQLIKDVLAPIPADTTNVLDVGAGTGNVTKALLKRGLRVVALENNLPMLEKLRAKDLDSAGGRLILNKTSAENMEAVEPNSFDAVVAMNVLYALNDPLAFINKVSQVLRPGGIFSFSTTHSETDLDPLLSAIERQLKKEGKYAANEVHFKRVCEVNKSLENTIVKRYAREDYISWVEAAGFEIIKVIPEAYEGAVMIVHARLA